MNRDQGLRRTTVLTASLIAAGLAGSIGIGIAAHAADRTTGGTATSSTTTDSSTSSSGSSSSGGGPGTSPQLSTGSDDSGQATSGGS